MLKGKAKLPVVSWNAVHHQSCRKRWLKGLKPKYSDSMFSPASMLAQFNGSFKRVIPWVFILRSTIFLSKFTFYFQEANEFLGAPVSVRLPLPVSVLSYWRSSKQVDAPFRFGHSSLPYPWDAVPIEMYSPHSHISWRYLLRHLCTQEFFQEIPIFLDSHSFHPTSPFIHCTSSKNMTFIGLSLTIIQAPLRHLLFICIIESKA